MAEVTFRTEAAEEAIRVMADRGDLLVGAGTVLSAEQADRAQQAGARFAVSPGYSAEVVRRCRVIGLPIFPGVATPTDIEMALDNGLQTLKFFPAEAFGGVGTLKAISAPYTMVRFIPNGRDQREEPSRLLGPATGRGVRRELDGQAGPLRRRLVR